MRCPSCTEDGNLACTGCRNVSYCSLVCQQTDWQFHKVLCSTWRDFQVRPSPEMRRVVSFPVDATKPQFAWLAINPDMKDAYDNPIEGVDARPLMGDVFPKPMTCGSNPMVDADLDYGINLCHDDNFLAKYTHDNAAITAATNRKAGHAWRGPLFAYCGQLRGQEIVKVDDMDMNSYSNLVALLIDYNNKTASHQRRKGPKIQGVRAHCKGELSKGLGESVQVPRLHPIFDDGEVSAISKNVGMSLLLRKDVRKKWPIHPQNHDYCNSALTFMMLACDPQKSSFGWAPPEWQGGQVPNVLIVRQDRKPLDKDVVEAFGAFCENSLQGSFELATELADNPLQYRSAVREVERRMMPETWTRFLSTWESPEKQYQAQLARHMPDLMSGNYKSLRKGF